MSFSLKATLTITYGPIPHDFAPKKKTQLPTRLTSRPESQPHVVVDPMEGSLSPEILAMQRGIREKKRREQRDAKPTGHATVGKEDEAAAATTSTKPVDKYHSWEKVSLADVQLVNLKAMDLTDLSASLLEHPKGTDVEYGERERRVLKS